MHDLAIHATVPTPEPPVRRVVELSPRDTLSEEESKALALAGGAPYAWPLRSANPQHLRWVGG